MSPSLYTERDAQSVLRVIPDLIRSRELLWDLVWKEFRVRYRFAVLGFAWAVLEPLLMCLVLIFVFSFVFQLRNLDPSIESRWDFAALLLCALIPWQFFSQSLITGTTSLVDHHELVGKVYFPREVIPLSAVGIAAVNFLVGFVILVLLLTLFGMMPDRSIVWVVPVFFIQLVLVCGMVLLLSAANVYFRDIRSMVQVGIAFGFYATPIFYTLNTVRNALEERLPGWQTFWRGLYMANPMVGISSAYREVLVYHRAPSPEYLVWPAVLGVILLAAGLYTFRRVSGLFADYL